MHMKTEKFHKNLFRKISNVVSRNSFLSTYKKYRYSENTNSSISKLLVLAVCNQYQILVICLVFFLVNIATVQTYWYFQTVAVLIRVFARSFTISPAVPKLGKIISRLVIFW